MFTIKKISLASKLKHTIVTPMNTGCNNVLIL